MNLTLITEPNDTEFTITSSGSKISLMKIMIMIPKSLSLLTKG